MRRVVVGLRSECWTTAGVQVQLRKEERQCVEVRRRKRLLSHKLVHWAQGPEVQLPLSVQRSLSEGRVQYLAGRR